MKTTILLATFACFMAISASQAGQNPLIRICHNEGGDFVDLAPGQEQDLPVCDLGSGQIGAQALVDHVSGQDDQAVSTFLSSQSSDPSQVCDSNGAQELQGQNDGAPAYDLCQFSDGSTISAQTLAAGASDPSNSALRAALTRHYSN